MKKLIIPLCLLFFVSAAIHVSLLIIHSLITHDITIWNYFKILDVTYFIPALDSATGLVVSAILVIILYSILYITYNNGSWNKLLR